MATDIEFASAHRDARIGLLLSAAEIPSIDFVDDAKMLVITCDTLCAVIRAGDMAGAIVGEEVLDDQCLAAIEDALDAQPYWSNFPFVMLVAPQDQGFERLRNVALVPKPVDRVLLTHAVRVATGSRGRQWRAGSRYQQLVQAEAQYQQLAMTLDAQVKARTADLRTANERLMREIDERRGAEARLRESEELYRYTVELSQQFVWIAKPDGRIIPISPSFSRLTGSPASDVRWINTVHPDDREQLLATWGDIQQRRAPGTTEFRLRMADGAYRMFRARAAPRLDDAGAILLWYGFTEDIEEQKQAEAARVAAEERYRLVARATNDAIWDLDLVEGTIEWSDTALETLGYPRQRSTTTHLKWWEERLHPEDRAQVADTLSEAIEGGSKRWSETYRFRRGDGEYATFFDRGFILRNAEGAAVRAVGAMADISKRQHAEEEIRRMQAELVHVSRLSAMGTMASTLAHEINQPLTAVANYLRGSRRLLETADGPRIGDARNGLEAAERSALLAGQIVRRLRELVAKRNAQTRVEDVGKLIEEAGVLGFLDAHLQGVTRSIEIDPDARWVEVDPVQIQQVLINLIRNAIQAMQHVDVRAITIATQKRSGDAVEVSVADTGSGVSPEMKEALFSPFHGNKEEGLGIGLSISRTIIEAHGGKIWAEDRSGGGTIFRFTLPLADQSKSEPDAAPTE